MKWFLNLKVHKKVIVVNFLSSLLPISILFVLFYGQMVNILKEREMGNLQAVFGQAAEQFDTEMQLHARMSEYIAFHQTMAVIINNGDQNNYGAYQRIVKEFDPMMDYIQFLYKNVTQATIYAGDEIIPHGNYLQSLSEVAEEPWTKVVEGVVQWYANQDLGQLYFVQEMPLIEKDDAILYIALDYENMFGQLDLDLTYAYDLYVYDDNHQILYSNHPKGEEAILSYEEFLKERKKDNSSYVTLEREIAQTGWRVGFCMKESRIIDPLQPILLMSVLIGASCIILSLGATLFLSANISGRIRKLNGAMEEVEQGNLEVEMLDEQLDEIGDLSRGFNHMVGELRHLIEEVYKGKIRQKKYEMTALRAQINPHFLYNSLSLINWKALEIGADDISKATLALSRYYRTSLNKGKNVMPIREEIDNVRAYLEIQEMFHDYSFQVNIEVAEEILELETLNLVLQPLAENAIAHGIDRKREGKGILTITGELEGGCVLLKVADNGVGMSPEKAEQILSSKSSGYGVRNVNSRIKLQYGEEYGLSVQSIEGLGTEITVRFPVVRNVGQEQKKA